MFFTDNANISNYLSSGNYSQPLVLSKIVSLEVTIIDNYQIMLVFSGPFLAELTGTYGCFSSTSGVRSAILLVYGRYTMSMYSVLIYLILWYMILHVTIIFRYCLISCNIPQKYCSTGLFLFNLHRVCFYSSW